MGGISELEVFIGEWTVEVRLPDGHPAGGNGGPTPTARSVFEWALDRKYLIQRSEVDHPDVPDAMSVYSADPAGGYVQHYFDSRGVTRLYSMTLAGDTWTLIRDRADFSPLDFRQRYVGTFSADSARIDGAWEIAHPGEDFAHDLTLNYVKKV